MLVGRTRAWGRVCLGAIALPSGRAVRLVPSSYRPADEGSRFWPSSTPYQLGDILRIEYTETTCHAPHVEDILVSKHRKVGSSSNLKEAILKHGNIETGRLSDLFGGKLGIQTSRGKLAVDLASPPENSTVFWIAEEQLDLYEESDYKGNPKFFYRTAGGITVAFVGDTSKPPKVILKGALVRFSLSMPMDWDGSNACWLQLSHSY
jgi:hypothetical protein